MNVEKPHDIIDDPVELARRKKLKEIYFPLQDKEAEELKEKTVEERSAWLQQRFDQIANLNKAKMQ